MNSSQRNMLLLKAQLRNKSTEMRLENMHLPKRKAVNVSINATVVAVYLHCRDLQRNKAFALLVFDNFATENKEHSACFFGSKLDSQTTRCTRLRLVVPLEF